MQYIVAAVPFGAGELVIYEWFALFTDWLNRRQVGAAAQHRWCDAAMSSKYVCSVLTTRSSSTAFELTFGLSPRRLFCKESLSVEIVVSKSLIVLSTAVPPPAATPPSARLLLLLLLLRSGSFVDIFVEFFYNIW